MKRKRIKLFLWFLFAVLIDITATHYMQIMNARPMLTYALIIAIMILEEDFYYGITVTAIASVILASLGGKSFFIEGTFLLLSGTAVYAIKKVPKYMSNLPKACIYIAVMSVLYVCVSRLTDYNMTAIILSGKTLIATVIYNVVCMLIIFPLFSKSVYKKDIKKKLITW